MKNFLLTAMLLGSTAVFGQVIGLSGFEVRDDGTFRKSFKTEQEAILKYQEIISVNGFDTLNIVFDHGDNPVVFDSFKKDNNKIVNIGTIVRYSNGFDILFFTIPNKKTHIMTVLNNNGDEVNLIYSQKL
jgi:hypothetical protein